MKVVRPELDSDSKLAPFTRGFQLASGSYSPSTSRGRLNPESFKSYVTGSELKSSCEYRLKKLMAPAINDFKWGKAGCV